MSREVDPVQTQMAVGVLNNPLARGSLKVEGKQPAGRRRVFVQTDDGCVLGLELDRIDNAHTVKRKLQLALNVSTEESSLTFGDMVLEDDLSAIRKDSPLLLSRNHLHRSSSTPCLSPSGRDIQQKDTSGPIEILGNSDSFDSTRQMVKDIVKAIKHGVEPLPAQGGLGGAYFFRNIRGECVAIVKPTDEEPFAPNNPKGFVGRALGQPGLKRSVRVGETGIREVAAYLLDDGHFANVPATVLVKVTHSIFNINDGMNGNNPHKKKLVSKIASFQQFVPHDFDASDYGTSGFPVSAVHRIGILDIRILNTDRHAGNLLVRRPDGFGRFGPVELIPIDHGLCLPESLEDPYFEWVHWPQASIPFSDDELEYINNLDPARDCEMLRKELPMIRDACLRVLVLCTIFLKEAATYGLCLAEIGEMMTREFRSGDEVPSELEVVCLEARMLIAVEKEELHSPRSQSGEDEFQFDIEFEDLVWDLNPRMSGNGIGRNPLSRLEESNEEEEEDEVEKPGMGFNGFLATKNFPPVSQISMSLQNTSLGGKVYKSHAKKPENGSTSLGHRSAEEQLPASASFVLSGPIERGALSGPLDPSSGAGEAAGVPFSAPLGPGGGLYPMRRRKKSFSGIKKAFQRSMSEKKRPWVVPVRNFAHRKEASVVENESERNVQWALGKAGEDRVHVVVSEANGWLFVGIYDGFNGPDAPEFLMSHLYRAVYNELKGLFWDSEDSVSSSSSNHQTVDGQSYVNIHSSCSVTTPAVEELHPSVSKEICENGKVQGESSRDNRVPSVEFNGGSVRKVSFQSDKRETRRKLWEFLAEDDAEDGLDLSGSERFAFSVDDAVRVSNAGCAGGRQSLLLSRLKQGLSRNKDAQTRGLFTWRFTAEEKEKNETVDRVEERVPRGCRRRKSGLVDHGLVLRALSQALEKTELSYLDLTDKVINEYPELALMGSCLLVVLMRDEDVYVMNLGDSRAIVAQLETPENAVNMEWKGKEEIGPITKGIVEESVGGMSSSVSNEALGQLRKLTALQLSTDHSTSVEEEVLRIKREHPDDNQCIVNDRVKGRLKVTRAFGAGCLKQAKFNESLLEMFRNEFIGSAPYVSCIPSLCHYKLGTRDQFLILSSDGLYQYLSNQEVVSHVANFMENNQDGDPAQHLIEELLSRAAKKAGMDFHDLLDIPQGDRRKYHDDVTVMVISLEGRIWKSSGKYP